MKEEFVVCWADESFDCADDGIEVNGGFEEAKIECLRGYRNYMELSDSWADLPKEERDEMWNEMIGSCSCWVEKLVGDGAYEKVWTPSVEELEAIGWKKV